MEQLFKLAIDDDQKLTELVETLIEFGDSNNDKEIDYDEFKKAIEDICSIYKQQAPPENEIKQVFANIDTDKSQRLSKQEIKIMIKKIFN